MLAGHYATALVANQHFQKTKNVLLFFLIASQLQDLAWHIFHFFGLEPTQPHDVLNASLSNMDVNMQYSHDLIPLSLWSILIFGIGMLLFNNSKIALTGVALVLGHFILDFISGHPHHIFGLDTHEVGLGLYATHIYIAIIIEIIFCAICLWYFFNKEAKNNIYRSKSNMMYIIGLFCFSAIFMLSIASYSFRESLGIPDFDLGMNTTVPFLITTYIGMIVYLNYYVRKARVKYPKDEL